MPGLTLARKQKKTFYLQNNKWTEEYSCRMRRVAGGFSISLVESFTFLALAIFIPLGDEICVSCDIP